MSLDHGAEVLHRSPVPGKPEPEQAGERESDDGGFYEFGFHIFRLGFDDNQITH